jgi:hypothetical protein
LVGQNVFDGFNQLAIQHSKAPSQAKAITRRVVNMHVRALRDSETLYQLKEGEALELLMRASSPKAGRAPVLKKTVEAVEDEKEKDKAKEGEEEEVQTESTPKAKSTPISAAPTVPMEDWWLTRDSQKRIGWILGRMLEVEIPLEIAQYAEGQRIIASHVLSEVPEDGTPEAKKVPQFLVLMSEPRDGMPFDFNQLRVFTWNSKRSRYETAYRERLVGQLPYKVGHEQFGKEGLLPYFAIQARDAEGKLQERKYKMNGVMVRRVNTELSAGSAAGKKR